MQSLSARVIYDISTAQDTRKDKWKKHMRALSPVTPLANIGWYLLTYVSLISVVLLYCGFTSQTKQKKKKK